MPEKVNYKKIKRIQEEFNFEIENSHHCFLQGQSEYDGTIDYLGIYITNKVIDMKKYLMIVKLEHQRNIKTEYYSNTNVYTEPDIAIFLQEHREVQQISEENFRTELNRLLEMLESEDIR